MMKVMIIVQNIYEDNNREDYKDDDDDSCSNNDSGDDKDDNNDDDDDYLILLYFRGTWISRKFSRHISRVFNFAIAEKNCVCREFDFAKLLTIKWLYFFFFTKILR